MYQPLKPAAAAPKPGAATTRSVERRAAYEELTRGRPTPPPKNTISNITPVIVIGWMRRYWPIVVLLALLGGAGGYAAGTLIPPRYTSYSDILLNPNTLELVADDLYTRSASGDAQLIDVESKMRIVSSVSVLGRVVDTLNLVNDPEFVDPAATTNAGNAPRITAILELGERLRVSREERSYVVTVSVWASTPEKSATITDAVVNAFLLELNSAESDGARNASDELNQRLTQLRDDAAKAESAVVDYRRENGLTVTSDGQLSMQSAVQINTQVDTAREALIAAEARYAALAANNGGAAQESETLASLRAQYAVAKQRTDALAATLGPRHPSLATASAELAALQGEVDQEVARIVDSARTDLQSAREVFDQLSNAAGTQLSDVFTDEQAQLELRQLERTATSAVAIYEAYLTRAQQVAERSQINTSTVRVISPAIAPISRSYPPRTMMLAAGGLFGGVMAGLALAAGLGFLSYSLPARTRRAAPRARAA